MATAGRCARPVATPTPNTTPKATLQWRPADNLNLYGSYSEGRKPGGFGTLDELMEALTLIQTGKARKIPLILVCSDFWRGMIDWFKDKLVSEGMVDPNDIHLIQLIDEPEQVVEAVAEAVIAEEVAEEAVAEAIVDIAVAEVVVEAIVEAEAEIAAEENPSA